MHVRALFHFRALGLRGSLASICAVMRRLERPDAAPETPVTPDTTRRSGGAYVAQSARLIQQCTQR